jgi:predicted DNA binding CopG/RHH family protein
LSQIFKRTWEQLIDRAKFKTDKKQFTTNSNWQSLEQNKCYMEKIKLDEYEENIEKNILTYKRASASKIAQIEKLIEEANNKKSISLRVNQQDFNQLKLRAEKEGIPYQTLISSIIHKFVTDQLVDERDVIKSLQLLKAKF